jgi:hypothetical protein
MKKRIIIKNKQKLTESSIKVGDINYSNRLRKRVTDVARALELAKNALQKAEQNGQTSLVAQLKARITELEHLLATYNTDTITPDIPSGNKHDGDEDSDRRSNSQRDPGNDGDDNDENGNNNDPDEE